MQTIAQETNRKTPVYKKITLNMILEKARISTLDMFKAKQKFGVSHWEFRSFKSSLLPKINFEAQPFTYNSTLVERYDSQQNIDVFRQQQTINSFANLSISQNIGITGTELYINSSFNRLENFGDLKIETYNTTPVRVGLSQPIMAFNSFKWRKRTAPLQYQKAQKDFLFELEEINIKAVNLFFNWALASKKVEIAKENKESADKLFDIGKKRFEVIAIERDELLNLELDVYNATNILSQNIQLLQQAGTELNLFLREPISNNAIPELPEQIPNLKIDLIEALKYANENNPEILNLKLKKTEARRDLDKAIKDNRFDLSISASYGLNEQANTFVDAYGRFVDQQMVSLQLSIPILDWGERKGNVKTAKMNKNVIDIELQQYEDSFIQDITLKTQEFNLQKDIVLGANRTREISKESYELTLQRFLSGNVDFLNLTTGRKAWQTANESYIQALHKYWILYYSVQKLTLYNFSKEITLSEDFDILIED